MYPSRSCRCESSPVGAGCNRSSCVAWPQVFFRAGVLGDLEELRDDKLNMIFSWMQAHIRSYFSRREFEKLKEQRYERTSRASQEATVCLFSEGAWL